VAASGACTQVSAALSDGPDPDADPIGHAQAQILPLRQISTTNDQLRSDIDGLAAAYQALVTTNNSAAAKQEVSRASNKVDKLCPGATS
jgi:outer membrane murein-binding lipoprotein Lpp